MASMSRIWHQVIKHSSTYPYALPRVYATRLNVINQLYEMNGHLASARQHVKGTIADAPATARSFCCAWPHNHQAKTQQKAQLCPNPKLRALGLLAILTTAACSTPHASARTANLHLPVIHRIRAPIQGFDDLTTATYEQRSKWQI